MRAIAQFVWLILSLAMCFLFLPVGIIMFIVLFFDVASSTKAATKKKEEKEFRRQTEKVARKTLVDFRATMDQVDEAGMETEVAIDTLETAKEDFLVLFPKEALRNPVFKSDYDALLLRARRRISELKKNADL